jgi:hypothetical protein
MDYLESLRKERLRKERLRKPFCQNWKNLERKYSERNNSERKHSEGSCTGTVAIYMFLKSYGNRLKSGWHQVKYTG